LSSLEKKSQVQNQVINELKKSKEDALFKLEALKKEILLVDQFLNQSQKEVSLEPGKKDKYNSKKKFQAKLKKIKQSLN